MMERTQKAAQICKICEKSFANRSTMNHHLRKLHKCQPELRKNSARIRCPNQDCKEICISMRALRDHISSSHGVQIETKQLSFPTFLDFSKWKESLEKKTWCRYVLKQGAVIRTSSRILYYICHRSGLRRKTKSTGKRKPKNGESYKLDAFCPAQMIVCVAKDVKVQFHTTHYGHNIDYQRTFLTASEREEIADKLRNGVDKNQILEDIRKKSFSEGFQRISLVTKKDLHNIARSLNNINKEKSDQNEEVIEEPCIEDLPDSPVMNENFPDSPVMNENFPDSPVMNENEELSIVLKKARMFVNMLEKHRPTNSEVLQKTNKHLDRLMSLANGRDTSHDNVAIHSTAKEPVNNKSQYQVSSPSRIRNCAPPLILCKPVNDKGQPHVNFPSTIRNSAPPLILCKPVNNKGQSQASFSSKIRKSAPPLILCKSINDKGQPHVNSPSTIRNSAPPLILCKSVNDKGQTQAISTSTIRNSAPPLILCKSVNDKGQPQASSPSTIRNSAPPLILCKSVNDKRQPHVNSPSTIRNCAPPLILCNSVNDIGQPQASSISTIRNSAPEPPLILCKPVNDGQPCAPPIILAISKPLESERRSMKPSKELLYIHTEFDHTY